MSEEAEMKPPLEPINPLTDYPPNEVRTWPATNRCSYCHETGRPSHCGMCEARNLIDVLRALVAEKDKALKRVQYNIRQMREYVACEVCKHTNETDREYIGQSRQETQVALALTEADMLKRLEEK